MQLSAIADKGGRFVEHRQDAFWELGQTRPSTRVDAPDGAFTYSNLPNYTPQGGGGTAFPNKQNFLDLGTIEYDGLTGAITALEMDFSQHMAPDVFTYYQAAVGASAYTTSFNSFSGTVTPSGAGTPLVNLTAEIVFSMESAFDGMMAYVGSFNVVNNEFVLDVDDVRNSRRFELFFPGAGDIRFIWSLTGAIGIMGDLNDDGVVDAADYTVWRDNLGGTGEMTPGDANRDQVVNTDDYLAWKENYGYPAADAGLMPSAVPEPSTAVLLIGVWFIGASSRSAARSSVTCATRVSQESTRQPVAGCLGGY